MFSWYAFNLQLLQKKKEAYHCNSKLQILHKEKF